MTAQALQDRGYANAAMVRQGLFEASCLQKSKSFLPLMHGVQWVPPELMSSRAAASLALFLCPLSEGPGAEVLNGTKIRKTF